MKKIFLTLSITTSLSVFSLERVVIGTGNNTTAAINHSKLLCNQWAKNNNVTNLQIDLFGEISTSNNAQVKAHCVGTQNLQD